MATEMCACGKPLHYVNPANEEAVERQIARLGCDIKVTNADGISWMIPRHYIALHGLREVDLYQLAARYGFPRTARQ